MIIEPTSLPGVLAVTPKVLTDPRGTFFEGLRTDLLEEVLGAPFAPRQVNYSASARNTLRGLHSVVVPPGQAKYVSCVRGAVRDIVVDLRVGSPTFGRHETTVLDAEQGRALYIPDGFGHGFLALTDDACVCYLVSTPFVPGTQLDLNPLDPELALPWGLAEPPIMSAKDREAPTLSEVMAHGALVRWRG